MKYIKIYGINVMIITLSILISYLLITFLSYNDLINDKTTNILEIIIIIASMFISGLMTGKKVSKNAWLEGLKTGLIIYIFLLVLNTIFIKDFNIRLFIYLIIIVLPSILGSMIGIFNKNLTN